MVIVLKPEISTQALSALVVFLSDRGAAVCRAGAREREILILHSNPAGLGAEAVGALEGVEQVLPLGQSYLLASRSFHPEPTVVAAGEAAFGATGLTLAAGPCAVEDAEQIEICARAVRAAGGTVLRGGSFKPRTSPYAFQGLGELGLRLHRDAADRHGLLVLSEVLDREDLPLVAQYADIFQVGSRNMQNFPLLKKLGTQAKPVLLKRGYAATREEFLLAAEYILRGGNGSVILCERGLRSFDPETRNSLDLASVCLLKEQTHLPVLVDPSHATGRASLVAPLARAAVAAGADGLLVEIHPEASRALSDGPQALTPEQFLALSRDIAAIAPVVGRTFEVTA